MKGNSVKTILVNLTVVGLFMYILQQGCAKNRVSPATDPPVEPDTILITPKPLFRLPAVLMESSGLAITTPGKIWSHNDSGNENQLYCFNLDGVLIRTITISNATNIDWEDLTVDPQKRIYIGDFGNNNNSRNNLVIYRIPDPETFTESSVTAEVINFSYEDQTSFPPPPSEMNYEMEAVIWHNDSLFLFTKDRTSPFAGYTKMYKMPATPGTHVAKASGSFFLGTTIPSARVTAADIHESSGRLALLVPNRVIVFSNYSGSRFFQGKVKNYPFTAILGQIESLVFASDSVIYISEEGAGSTPGFLYEVKFPVQQ
jgi:hypothetical protein